MIFSKQLKKWAKVKVLKQISDQKIKDNILENNLVPSKLMPSNLVPFSTKTRWLLTANFIRGWEKDKIFSDRSLMKGQEDLTNIMGPLGCLYANLDHLKKDNESAIDLNILLALVEQYVILEG